MEQETIQGTGQTVPVNFMQQNQVAFSFDLIKIKKIIRGAMIAGGGAASVYALTFLSQSDFGIYTPVVVALCSIAINAIKEWMSGVK